MLAAVDPMGMPLATLVLPGNEADDGLYIPSVIRARQILGQGNHLYVGDAKMGALDTRADCLSDWTMQSKRSWR